MEGLSGGAAVKNLPADAGDARETGSIPGLGRSHGEGNGNQLQYSCLGNPGGGFPRSLVGYCPWDCKELGKDRVQTLLNNWFTKCNRWYTWSKHLICLSKLRYDYLFENGCSPPSSPLPIGNLVIELLTTIFKSIIQSVSKGEHFFNRCIMLRVKLKVCLSDLFPKPGSVSFIWDERGCDLLLGRDGGYRDFITTSLREKNKYQLSLPPPPKT